MKRRLILILLCLLPLSLAWAGPFLSTQGVIMETDDVLGIIVVNERELFIDPSTTITDEQGRPVEFYELRPGRWVTIEAEPDETSRLVAQRIVLIDKR